jgi:hypothetical protein
VLEFARSSLMLPIAGAGSKPSVKFHRPTARFAVDHERARKERTVKNQGLNCASHCRSRGAALPQTLLPIVLHSHRFLHPF